MVVAVVVVLEPPVLEVIRLADSVLEEVRLAQSVAAPGISQAAMAVRGIGYLGLDRLNVWISLDQKKNKIK